ncbi:MAG TPA: hypothetical protein VE968_05815, partial [Sphingomicrobium sp.]|nr:hypothetical protein [Sphingomicrobium sp.]
GTRNLYSAGEEEAALKEKPLSPFKSPSGFLMVFRSDLRRFDDLWDLTIDQNEGNVIFAHDQWYFFLARALGEVRFVDEPLAIYRQHGGNTYGVPVSYSIGQRLARRLIHYGTADEWAALSAKSRATILRLIAERDGLARLGQLAQSYDDLAERRARRAKTYCRDSVAKRAAALLRSISAADYRGGAWAFEPASIARDAWSGVVQGKCKDPTRGC